MPNFQFTNECSQMDNLKQLDMTEITIKNPNANLEKLLGKNESDE